MQKGSGSRQRIIATLMEGMAFANPFNREPTAFQYSVFLQSLQCVFAAGRRETTARTVKGRNKSLIKADQRNQKSFHFIASQDSGFTPQRQYSLLCFLVGGACKEASCQHDYIIAALQLMPVKPVDFLHEPLGSVAGKSMSDLFGCHESHPDIRFSDFRHINQSGPVAAALSGPVNPPVILVQSYTGGTGKTEIRPFLFAFRIRHLIPFCPLLFFSSEQYGLLLSSYERGNRESVFSSGCSAGMSFLPSVTPPYLAAVPFFAP